MWVQLNHKCSSKAKSFLYLVAEVKSLDRFSVRRIQLTVAALELEERGEKEYGQPLRTESGPQLTATKKTSNLQKTWNCILSTT